MYGIKHVREKYVRGAKPVPVKMIMSDKQIDDIENKIREEYKQRFPVDYEYKKRNDAMNILDEQPNCYNEEVTGKSLI